MHPLMGPHDARVEQAVWTIHRHRLPAPSIDGGDERIMETKRVSDFNASGHAGARAVCLCGTSTTTGATTARANPADHAGDPTFDREATGVERHGRVAASHRRDQARRLRRAPREANPTARDDRTG